MNLLNFSWRGVIAGVVTALAVSVVMALLGVALGFVVVDPMSNDPLAGLGLTFGIWSVVSILLSLAAGGYVAGRIAPARGAEHGFMVWATVLVVGTLFSGLAVGTAVKSVGAVAGGVGSGVIQAAGSIGGGVADLAGNAIDAVHDNVYLDYEPSEIRDNVAAVLRDTGIPTLQPEYLRDQMREARSDFRTALNQISMNTDDFDQAIGTFLDRQKTRIDDLASTVDRDAAVTALASRRNISRSEAEGAVDGALVVYRRASEQAQNALSEARLQFEEARAHLAALAHQARVEADAFASAVARSAVLAALAIIIGAVVSSLTGLYGNRQYSHRYVVVEERQELASI